MLKVYISNYEYSKDSSGAEKAASKRLLETGLQEICGLRLADCQMGTGPHGKPYLLCPSGLCFNISHSRGRAVCAFSDRAVGADIQQRRAPSPRLVQRVLAESEQAGYAAMTAGGSTDSALLFAVYWALKESYLKYTGDGLSFPPEKAVFKVQQANTAPAGETFTGQMLAPDPALSYTVRTEGGFALALCSSSPEKPVFVRL